MMSGELIKDFLGVISGKQILLLFSWTLFSYIVQEPA